MKIGLFNSNAPKLINQFEKVLDKMLNGDTKGIDFKSLRANLNAAIALAGNVQKQLNGVSIAQLKVLRTNAKAGTEFGVAVDNAASLSHIADVIKNMADEIAPEGSEEEEVSLDDILDVADEEQQPEEQNSDDEGESDEDEDESEDDADAILNGGPAPIEAGEEDAEQESTDEEASVAEGDDISNTLKNFFGTSKPVMKKASNSSTVTNKSLVPDNFLM